MSLIRPSEDNAQTPWRQCQECGERYPASNHGYKVNWCSARCEDSAIRRQRKEVETTWIRGVWFLR